MYINFLIFLVIFTFNLSYASAENKLGTCSYVSRPLLKVVHMDKSEKYDNELSFPEIQKLLLQRKVKLQKGTGPGLLRTPYNLSSSGTSSASTAPECKQYKTIKDSQNNTEVCYIKK
jgi:hypothetical protein